MDRLECVETFPDTAGDSFNRNNVVFHSTFHFSGTNADGASLRVEDISHTNTNAANPFGPPNSFEILRCS